ncbi:MAG: hypothetical protein IPN34_05830 [Planctomycetes bacterium]|nr:hypothetical protein [Planctomycetota bacterium]
MPHGSEKPLGSEKSSGAEKPAVAGRSSRRTSARKERAPRASAAIEEGERGLKKGRWSTSELAWLRENFARRRDEALVRELGRPIESLRKMAEQIFRGPRVSGEWTAAEDALLREGLGVRGEAELAMVLRRGEADLRQRVRSFARTGRTGRWTQGEIADLKRLFGSRRDEDLVSIFGRSLASIRRQAKALQLAKDKGFLRRLEGGPASRMPRWSPDEIRQLARLYAELPNLEVARRLGRSVKSIVSKAHELDLKKSEERLRDMGRQNVSLREDRAAARATKRAARGRAPKSVKPASE